MSDVSVSGEPFEVRDTGDSRGLGCFATRDIEAGEVILVDETPVVWRSTVDKNDTVNQLLSIHESMEESLRREWSSLAKCDMPGLRSEYEAILLKRRSEGANWTDEELQYFLGLFMAIEGNSFGASKSKSALYLKASRFNHSCDPNVWYENNPPSHWVGMASRSIAKGEELLITYLLLCQSTRDRRRTTRRSWGFTCNCPKCTGGVDVYTASLEEARDALMNVDRDVIKPEPMFDTNADMKQMASHVRRRANLLTEIVSLQRGSKRDKSRRMELVFALWEASLLHRMFFMHWISEDRGNNRQRAQAHLRKDRAYIVKAFDVAATICDKRHDVPKYIRKDIRRVLKLCDVHKFGEDRALQLRAESPDVEVRIQWVGDEH